jgi:hypothetical protein
MSDNREEMAAKARERHAKKNPKKTPDGAEKKRAQDAGGGSKKAGGPSKA